MSETTTTQSVAPVSETPEAVLPPVRDTRLERQYQQLFKDGKLIQLHIRRWSMATTLREEDLGLPEGADIPEYVVLGHKRLIDASVTKKFVAIELKARAFLKKQSLFFPIAHAHFVPAKLLVATLEELEKLRAAYLEHVSDFLRDYETHKQAMLAKFPDRAEALLPCYPSQERLAERFGFSISMFEISIPEAMQEFNMEEFAASEEAKQELQKKYASLYADHYERSLGEVQRFLNEAVVSVRGRVVEVFTLISDKIRKGEVISTVNLRTMGSIIDAFDGLDFLDDVSVRQQLESVRGVLATGRDFKEDQEALDALGVAVGNVLEVARNTSDIDSVTGGYARRIQLG